MDTSNLYASNRQFTSDLEEKFRPRTVTLVKDKTGFGFTLRHFIVYPPASISSDQTPQENNEDSSHGNTETKQWKSDYKSKPMDTIFIREVKDGSPAHNAGLNKGDRIIAINNHPLTGKSYSDIIHLILKSGQTLKLLVVPKEDDILQLYFATSAYQPVHREQKQHKYLVPNFEQTSDLSNSLFKQSNYGTYPGRTLNKIEPSVNQIVETQENTASIGVDKSNSHLHPSNYKNHPAQRRSYDFSFTSDEQTISGRCYSEDEDHYEESKSITNSAFHSLQPPKLKDTVANFYYSLCTDQPSSVFSFSSEDNLNYPLYMSDFDETLHCDNKMEERENVMAMPLHSSNPLHSYDFHKPHYIEEKYTGDRNSSCVYLPDSQVTMFRTDNTSDKSMDCSPNFTSGHLNQQSNSLYDKSSDNNLPESNCDLQENNDVLSINLVAQRRHQFESGNLLAESLERMNMYRSELSRMSQTNQVRIVQSRTAHFENKSQVPSSSQRDNNIHSEVLLKQEDDLPDKIEKYAQDNQMQIKHSELDSPLDHKNHNKIISENAALNFSPDTSELVVAKPAHAEYSPVTSGVVHRRKTVPGSSDQDECHIVRRISYLRATAGDRMNIESDLSEEDEISDAISPNKEYRIQKLKSFFGEKTPKVKQALQPIEVEELEKSSELNVQEEPKSVYGWVMCKVVSLEGKRSSDRSWRHLWAILRNNILYLLKDRREPSKGSLMGDEHVINVKYSIAKIANDYVKRKHVLRLMLLNGTEYLVQTESHKSMMEWLNALQIFAKEIAELPEWLKNTSVLEKAAAYEQQIQTNKGKLIGQHHPVRKLVFRHRSPSENSPTIKTRRASQGDELALTKIGVLWRDRMVQGWKKVHGSSSQSSTKDASFGVKLENAPSGVANEHVPLIVELCVQIVESRGLDVVGIYRVPGNNASVSILTDLINQGIDDIVLQDARWNDVNIVSSLLKAYFRKLPEPLLTSYLYPKFIQASKIEDPLKRLKAIKHVLYHLPVHYFATLKYLMYHLKKVVEHSATNKMEARNLAIVFGPTLVRTTDNNMVTMVTDMSHQCYLIETMIIYADWLFEDNGELLPLEMNPQDKRKTHPPSTLESTALLSNLNKLDGMHESNLDSLPHEIFSSFYNTAARHLRHRHKKKDANKRSGIIADDTNLLTNHNENNMSKILDNSSTNLNNPENLSDLSFGSCSSLISGSSKMKQRSLSKEYGQNSISPCETSIPSSNSQIDDTRIPNPDEDIIFHRYNELSTLAQEKIKNFEQETKALLRRDFQRPRASIGSPQVEWEQIEKEWQKAKLELEQEDLLDHLADDPSYLSCLLNRGIESSPSTISSLDNNLNGKNQYSMNSSSLSVKEFFDDKTKSEDIFLQPSTDKQSDKCLLKYDKDSLTGHKNREASRTKIDRKEITASASQPSLSISLNDQTADTIISIREMAISPIPKIAVSSSLTPLAPKTSDLSTNCIDTKSSTNKNVPISYAQSNNDSFSNSQDPDKKDISLTS